MAQSPEYPDLPWIPPKSWRDANRSSIQLIVIHTTEGAARSGAARDGALYNQRRTDGTSAHYFVDSGAVVQGVRTADIAHTARSQGNRRGVQYELCGRTTLDWSGEYAQAMLRRAARQAARDAKKWGIPVRKLSPAQVADGVKGFCGHVDITHAFPADRGTHTDPGPNFPWSQFLGLVRDEMEEDDMPSAEEIAAAVWNHKEIDPATGRRTYRMGGAVRMETVRRDQQTARIVAAITAAAKGDQAALAAIRQQIGALGAQVDDVDEAQIVTGVLAGLPADRIAAAIPAELAEQVAQRLADRLAA